MEGDAAIFGMDSTVMTEKKIASHKGAAALHALERALLGICDRGLACICRARNDDDDVGKSNIRDRSCLLLCSLLLKARLQNWHLYFLSGASEAFRVAGFDAAEDGMTATLAPGILWTVVAFARRAGENRTAAMWIGGDGDNDNGTRELVLDPPHRTIVEIAWLLSLARALPWDLKCVVRTPSRVAAHW